MDSPPLSWWAGLTCTHSVPDYGQAGLTHAPLRPRCGGGGGGGGGVVDGSREWSPVAKVMTSAAT